MVFDLFLGVWVLAVAAVVFVVIPAMALGRPAGRSQWWPDILAATVWSVLAVVVVAPLLASLRLLNWATAVMVPLAWPTALWLYRYRGAPGGAFRALCRRTTLSLLTTGQRSFGEPPPSTAVGHTCCRRAAVVVTTGCAALLPVSARELRFSSPADYDVLAHSRAMLAGGPWLHDPAASIAAILARLAAVDPMQALRFLRPVTAPGSLIAATVGQSSLNAAA